MSLEILSFIVTHFIKNSTLNAKCDITKLAIIFYFKKSWRHEWDSFQCSCETEMINSFLNEFKQSSFFRTPKKMNKRRMKNQFFLNCPFIVHLHNFFFLRCFRAMSNYMELSQCLCSPQKFWNTWKKYKNNMYNFTIQLFNKKSHY